MENHEGHGTGSVANNKWLIYILVSLVLVIVGLVVGVVSLRTTNNQTEEESYGNSETDYEGVRGGGLQALAINEEITNKINTDKSYSVEDAIEEYERETSFGDVEKRVYLLFDYANFIYDEYGDVEAATDIARRAEALLNSISITADYYIAMAALYEKAGYVEQVELYNKKLTDITPQVSPDMMRPEDVDNNVEGGDK